MSPTASDPVLDPSGHPPVETIADYLEDLLPADAGTRLRAHLADCPACRDTRAALEEVRSLLGRTATPTLPADIAARFDAALAAEALPGTGAVPTAADAAPRKAHSTPAAPGRRPGGPTGPGAGRSRSRHWRRAVLGVAALALVGLVGTAVLQSGSNNSKSATSTSAGTSAGAAALPPTLTADVPITDANLPGQVRQLLSGTTTPHALLRPDNGPAAEPGPVPDCVLSATGRVGETPLAIARSVYRGIPVLLVVYSARTGPSGSVDAYLVAVSCSPQGGLLLHRTVASG